ncbi:MAG: DUF6017 domain-containing protein, partial [Eubacterium sp.]|nr:DUF6017 domain-containing protein [Eubacterium sp.]
GMEYIIYEKPVNVAAEIYNSELTETVGGTTSANYDDKNTSKSFKPDVSEVYAEPCFNYCLESKTENYVHTEITFEEPFSAVPVSETPIRENPVQGNTTQINNKLNNILNKVSINSIYSSQKSISDRYEMRRSIPTENKYLFYTDKVCEIKENLNYDDVLKAQCTGSEIEIIDYIIEIIAQTMLSDSRTIRIGRQNLPSVIVKKRFNELWYEDILYVLDRLSKAQTRVKNIKNYMLTALYNAPADSSFTATENYRNRNLNSIKQPSMYSSRTNSFNNFTGSGFDEFDPVDMALQLMEN